MLTPKQKRLAAMWGRAGGNIKEAARLAGISYEYARKVVLRPEFKKAVKRRGQYMEQKGLILGDDDLRVMWSSMALDEERPDTTRLLAARDLAKSKGMFVERRVIENEQPWPVHFGPFKQNEAEDADSE